MKTITAPLSKEEVKSLQQQTYLGYGVFLIVLLGFLILIYHIYQEVSIENQSWLQFEFKRLVVLPLVFVIIFILRMSMAMKNSLKNGQKEILSGILTKKEEIPRPFGNHPDYSICIDEQEIVITRGQIPVMLISD